MHGPYITGVCTGVVGAVHARPSAGGNADQEAIVVNMLGAYGEWAASLCPDPPRLSFRRPEFTDIRHWRDQARGRYRDALMAPPGGPTPTATVQHHVEYDSLSIEHLTWQLPYGPPTEALLLKPAKATGRLPGIVGLHDHGGNKYFGARKITRMSADPHPLMVAHQKQY